MLNLWEKSKIVVYFEDEEVEGFIPYTMSNVVQEPTNENIEAVASAVNTLSELPMAHLILTESRRYVI